MDKVLNKIIEDYNNKVPINKLYYIIPVSLNTDLAIQTSKGFIFDINNLINVGILNNQLINIKKIRMYSFNLKNINPVFSVDEPERSIYVNLVNINSESFLDKNYKRYHFKLAFFPFYYSTPTFNVGQAYPNDFIYEEFIFKSKISVLTELNIELYILETDEYITTNSNSIILQFDFYCL